MERVIKKILTAFFILAATWVVTAGYRLSVYAQDGVKEIQAGQFMKTLQKTDVKEKPNENAETIFSYDVGDYVYVTGETVNGWLIVYYQGQTGYIKNDVSQGIEAVQDGQDAQVALEVEELDIEALDDELASQEVENKLIAEGVERYLKEARRSKIWGALIVLLVTGIFAVGIISTVVSEKKNREEDDIT